MLSIPVASFYKNVSLIFATLDSLMREILHSSVARSDGMVDSVNTVDLEEP